MPNASLLHSSRRCGHGNAGDSDTYDERAGLSPSPGHDRGSGGSGRRLDRAKADFLESMEQAVRTRMDAIASMTELMLLGNPPTELREELRVVAGAADSLLELVADLVDYAAIESGTLEVRPRDFHLRELVETTTIALAAKAKGKGLDFAFEIHPRVPRCARGDARRLRQVIQILLGNAIQHTAAGAVTVRVDCETTPEGHRLFVDVADTGAGIPASKLLDLFGPHPCFPGAERSGPEPGSGLGLGLVALLVQLMGGEITVQSQVDIGSTFSFYVKLRDARTVHESLPPARLLRGLRALVVDGAHGDARSTMQLLGSLGVRPRATSDVAEALDLLRDRATSLTPFDFVLVSPRGALDAFSLIRSIRSDPSLARTRIVLLSKDGSCFATARREGLHIDAHLDKPVASPVLRQTLQALLADTNHPVTRQPPALSIDRGRRVLIAEDNRTNQAIAKHMLEREGHRVTVVSNGFEALEACRLQGFDLVLMDIQMPQMGGVEATRLIRAMERALDRRTPIVALSAQSADDDNGRLLAAGFDRLLEKPISLEAIRGALGELSERSAGASADFRSKLPMTSSLGVSPAFVPEMPRCPTISLRPNLDAGAPWYPALAVQRLGDEAAIAARHAASTLPPPEEQLASGAAGGSDEPASPEAAEKDPRIDAQRALLRDKFVVDMGGDAEIFELAAASFVAEWPKLAETLREALDSRERDSIRRFAHRVKGAVSHFYAPEASALAAKLESTEPTADWHEVARDGQALLQAVARLSDVLAARSSA